MATSNAATTYLEHRILNFIFNNNAQVSSANFGSGNANGLGSNIYVGLATAVSNFDDSTGESADAGSVSVTAWTLVSPTANQQTAKNTNAIDFAAKTDSGTQTITHVFINDASSSGNFLFIGALDASKTLAEGDIFRINATNLSIELK
jgi:hypothetical protein